MTDLRWADAAHTTVRRSDGAFIPADPANRDFAALEPAAIAPFIAPPPAPVQVSPWQAREALRIAGRLAQVDAFIEAQGPQSPVYIAYHYAERFSRASPLIAGLKAELGMTDADLDGLFALAKSLSL